MFKLNLLVAVLFSSTVLGVIGLIHGMYRGRAQNYRDKQGPYFEGRFSAGGVESSWGIIVGSYNIRFGEKIPQALRDLQSDDRLKNADILLLQEMDEIGTGLLAAELGYNYIYYPSTIHPRSGRNFGNAIMSKWPIKEANKVILPHESWLSGIQRTATKAKVEINRRTVLVYSIHNEYFLSSQEQRQDQLKAILEDIESGADYVVIGGDLNTFGGNGVLDIDRHMSSHGLTRAHQGDSPTITKFGVKVTTDHIYVRGYSILDAGTVRAREGSDHYPIWARLAG